MQSHRDDDNPLSPDILKRLGIKPTTQLPDVAARMESVRKRADRALATGESGITAGRDGESVLEERVAGQFVVRHLQDDSDGVLRISIGEMPGVQNSAYHN